MRATNCTHVTCDLSSSRIFSILLLPQMSKVRNVFSNTPVSVAEHSRLYRTGDFARLVKGSLVYEGRTDSQVKVRGHRVDLSEVERAVAAVPGIDKSVVLCYEPGGTEQVINLITSLGGHVQVQ